MKNVLDLKTREELISRIDKMTPRSKALWGKMSSAQALRHMTMAFQIPMKEITPVVKKLKMPKWLMKFFLLNVKAPKAKAETYYEINTVANNIVPADFESERKNLKNYLEKFVSASSLLEENPLAGKFTRRDWGRLMYTHSDHHLRQFGV